MRRVYTHENRLFVSNAKNILDNANIANQLKNEYAGGAAGDLAPLDAWMELWVVDDANYEAALQLVKNAFDNDLDTDWHCQQCHENNPSSFTICWQCNASKP